MGRSRSRTVLSLVETLTLPLAVLVLAPAAALAAPSASATPELEGRTIVGLEVVGAHTVPEETFLHYLELEVGARFSRSRLDAAIGRLWERKLVDDVAVEALPAEAADGEAGVRLVVRVAERPRVLGVVYEGLERVGRQEVEEQLAREGTAVLEGGPLNLGEVHRVAALLERMYAEKGFRFARVEHRLEPASAGGPSASGAEVRVVFTIDEGGRVRIGDLRFEGNTVYRDLRLRWEMKNSKQSGLLTRLTKKDVYDPAKLAEDLDRVRDLYRDAGYKEVVVGEAWVRVAVEDPQAPPSEQVRRLVITVPIEEGGRWRLGTVRVEGNETFHDAVLLSAFRHRPGAWLRADTVREGADAIEGIYHDTGYVQARVTTDLVEVDERTADVVVRVEEGERFRVGRIEFEGNTRTQDRVLRRELRVQEGRVLSLGALRASLYKLGQLGYFELDQQEPVEFSFRDEANEVDIEVRGREADRSEFQFGAGFSEGIGFFGQASVSSRNFLGRGERASLAVQSGARTDYYQASYFVPWFLDRPQSAGLQVSDRTDELELLEGVRSRRQRTAASVSYGRSLGLFQTLGVSYGYSDQSFRDTTTEDGVVTAVDEASLEISSLRPAYTWDSVDDRFEPRRGLRLQGVFEYAGGPLGGSESFLRPTLSATWYRPLTGYPLETVLGVNVEGGLIEPFGGDSLSRFNLFELGGDTSVRGFERSQLFARDEETGRPIRVIDGRLDRGGAPVGGDRYVQANLEYHLLLGGAFRVIGFVDAGQVYAPSFLGTDGEPTGRQSFDLGRLRTTAGAELRITLPLLGGAPLRFIWAENLDPQPGDEFNSFSFSLGSTF